MVVVAEAFPVRADRGLRRPLAQVVVPRLQDERYGRVEARERALEGFHLVGDGWFPREAVDEVARDDHEAWLESVHVLDGQREHI